MTQDQVLRLEKQLNGYAQKSVIVDATSSTGDVYAFMDELSMYRIAEKMRSMSNFSYGYSENLKTHYIRLCFEYSSKIELYNNQA